MSKMGYSLVTVTKDHREVTKYRHQDLHDVSVEFADRLLALVEQEIADTLNEIIAENTDTINGTTDANSVFDSVIGKIESLKGGI